MQEALKNTYYKKIWEKVIMNRHPKAKSLEEALSLEMSPFNGCMVLIDLTQFGYIMSANEPLKVVSYNKFGYFAIEPVYSKLIAVWDSCNKKVKNNAQILGRPITLEDIMLLLPANSTHFIKNVDGLLQIKIFRIDEVGCDFYIGTFYWQLTKLLHEQTPETLETITKI